MTQKNHATSPHGQATRRMPADALRRLMEELLVAAGTEPDHAAVAADAFLEADMRGHAIQGLDHMYSTLARLRSGRINGHARPRVVREGPGFALIEGDSALGQVAGAIAADLAVEKAREAGSAAVGVVAADDIFMLGYYAERIANAGCAGIVLTNSHPPRVRAPGGVDKVIGTNPWAVGVPTAGPHPFVFDAATSASAIGHVRIASYTDTPIPEGIAIDKAGRPTTDPAAALEGALEPLGGHKGFGLGLAAALLSGPLIRALIGAALERDDARQQGAMRRGHLFMAIDPNAFGDADAFRASVQAFLDEIKASRRAAGVDEILIPGERGFRARAAALSDGVPVRESVWAKTAERAAALGVALPE